MRLVVFIRLRCNRRKSNERLANHRSINSVSREPRSAAAVPIVHNAIHSMARQAEMFTYDRTTICYAIKYQVRPTTRKLHRETVPRTLNIHVDIRTRIFVLRFIFHSAVKIFLDSYRTNRRAIARDNSRRLFIRRFIRRSYNCNSFCDIWVCVL